MEKISKKVWNELVGTVGTIEQVFIRRRWFIVEDVIMNRVNSMNIISSGSMAEGFILPGSDIDVMTVFKDISVMCSENASLSESDIVMETIDIKPGFARLRCHDSLSRNSFFSLAVTLANKGLVLSSLLFRDAIVDISRKDVPDAEPHGPCSSYVLPSQIESDVLYCLSCKTWPIVATEWIHRDRVNNWPSRELISDIVHDGCLIVPIGNQQSQDSRLQWRISFSMAEKKLVHSMNHTQFLCYGLLKLYLKNVINLNPNVKDILCSYYIKTCVFYCIEEEHIVWNKENFLNCFWTCFRRLIKWVRDEYCPGYFIKENNMFEGKVYGEKGSILLRYLNELYHEGLDSFLRIPCLSELQISTINTPVRIPGVAERECLCDTEIFEDLSDIFPKDVIECMRILVLNAEMKETSSNAKDIDKVIFTLTYHNTMYHFVQLLYKQTLTDESNQSRYKRTKELKSFILHNCMSSDKCTGVLLLATLCYLNREYKEVVTITQKVLKKFKSCTFYVGLSGLGVVNVKTYFDKICGKGLTLNQKLACGIFCRLYNCRVDCKFYPSEIEQELDQHSGENNMAYINPMVYSYVMLFLSYLHTNRRESMNKTLRDLLTTVYNRQIVLESEAPLAISLLEKCIQLCESCQDNQTKS